jgi:hypothetical protein
MTRRIPTRTLFAAAAALAVLAPALASAAAPPPYTARYEVSRNGDRLGTATVTFRALPNGRYELVSDTVGSEGLAAIAGVSVNERSILRWGEQPETVAYDYRQKLAWKNKSRSLQVDAAGRRIASTDKDRSFSPPYEPGVLDRNAVVVALMSDLAGGRTGDLRYRIPDKDAVDTWVYRAAASEQVQTALGAQRAVRVERIRESGGGRSTTLWLGADRNYVPLRMLQKEPDGETIEMRIVSLR